MLAAKPYEATVERVERLTPTVRALALRLDPTGHDTPFRFRAGQFVQLLLPIGPADQPLVARSYSIASPPGESSRVEIAVTYVPGGAASMLLHGSKGGEKLRANGPHGFFTMDLPPARDAILIGTGTGVAPLRAMIKDALPRGRNRRLTLVEGVRSEADVLWGPELDALARAHENFRFIVTLSRPSEAWTGPTGYVQLRLRELVQEGADVDVYVCGLSKMTEEVRRILRQDLGLPRQRVHTERYD